LICIAMSAGCASRSRGAKPPAQESSTLSSTDPFATRLHDVSGPLLLYYARAHKLPEHLEELNQVPHDEPLEFTCPVSHQRYVYDPSGLLLSPNGRLIVFDATPAHAGLRWAIAAVESEAGGALVLKVVALPESFFAPGAGALTR